MSDNFAASVVFNREWRQQALCRGYDTQIFYPAERDITGLRQAKAICATCAVIEQCREEALENGERGVWGGLSDRERERLKRTGKLKRQQYLPANQRKDPTVRNTCGRPGGHVSHYRAGERACATCLEARRERYKKGE
jgi:WhiB family redox-sensing transcriptional regulator